MHHNRLTSSSHQRRQRLWVDPVHHIQRIFPIAYNLLIESFLAGRILVTEQLPVRCTEPVSSTHCPDQLVRVRLFLEISTLVSKLIITEGETEGK